MISRRMAVSSLASSHPQESFARAFVEWLTSCELGVLGSHVKLASEKRTSLSCLRFDQEWVRLAFLADCSERAMSWDYHRLIRQRQHAFVKRIHDLLR